MRITMDIDGGTLPTLDDICETLSDKYCSDCKFNIEELSPESGVCHFCWVGLVLNMKAINDRASTE